MALRLIFAFNVTYTGEKILLRVLFNAFNKFYVTFSLFFFGDSFRLLLPQHLVSKFTQDTKNDEMERRRRKIKKEELILGGLWAIFTRDRLSEEFLFHRLESLPFSELNNQGFVSKTRRGRLPSTSFAFGPAAARLAE